MNYWLLKSEPETWSWQQQVARGERGEAWTGVRNYQARNFLRDMKLGDQGFFYHSGKSKAIVGIVEVIQEHYPDPTDDTGRFVAVTVKALEALDKPVTLAQIKADGGLDELLLLRHSRLSVMPVGAKEWFKILSYSR